MPAVTETTDNNFLILSLHRFFFNFFAIGCRHERVSRVLLPYMGTAATILAQPEKLVVLVTVYDSADG